MSKNNQAVYPSMTATAGQSSDGWITMFKQLGLLPIHAQPLYQPNSLKEGLAALKNQGTYNGPLMEVVSRVPIGSLPQWTPELAENARQKVAWVYADAQSKGIQIPQIQPPDYDPRLPMGAHPVDIENYLRWEQMVDMQYKFPTSYEARLLPVPINGEVPQLDHRKSMFERVTELGQKVKERIDMDMNQNAQNFNQPAAAYVQPNQQPMQGQQAAQPQAPINPQQVAQQLGINGNISKEMSVADFAKAIGINPENAGWEIKLAVWMANHPKLAALSVLGCGALVVAIIRWTYGHFFGSTPEEDMSDDDAAAAAEIAEALNIW